MNSEPRIDVPDSYVTEHDRDREIPPSETIEKVPSNTNKVTKIVIRGVLKGDGFISNK